MRALIRCAVIAVAILSFFPTVALADSGPSQRGPWNTAGIPVLCIKGFHMEVHQQHGWTRCARD